MALEDVRGPQRTRKNCIGLEKTGKVWRGLERT